MCDYKKALRTVNSLLEKGEKKMHVVEKLSYKVVRVYVFDKSNRKQEANQEADETIKEILDSGITD